MRFKSEVIRRHHQTGIDLEQPECVCHDCGMKYGKGFVNTFGFFHISTFHNGTCGVCKQEKPVTQPRDFGYLKQKEQET